MTNIQIRKRIGALPDTMLVEERQALVGSEGYASERNRYITESDISRNLDRVLTDGEYVLLDQHGTLLYA